VVDEADRLLQPGYQGWLQQARVRVRVRVGVRVGVRVRARARVRLTTTGLPGLAAAGAARLRDWAR